MRVRGSGVVASIAISGLPSHQDHDMIVTTLAEHLGVTDIAQTPETQPVRANSAPEDQTSDGTSSPDPQTGSNHL